MISKRTQFKSSRFDYWIIICNGDNNVLSVVRLLIKISSVDSDFYSLTGHASVIVALLSHLSLPVTLWPLGSAISINPGLKYPAAVPTLFTREI
jgi:hypothetical protein